MPSTRAAKLTFTIAACLALAGSACHDDTLIKELRATRDQVCQCPDKACVTALRESSQKLEKRLDELCEDDQKKAQAIALEMMACVQKF